MDVKAKITTKNRIKILYQEANKGLVDVAFEQLKGTWKTIQKVKAMIKGALNAAAEAIKAILSDPLGFLDQLINGVKKLSNDSKKKDWQKFRNTPKRR